MDMDSFHLVMIFLMGACFGSFANVVIYRWPREESIVHPRSRCPQCASAIKFYQNIPIVSWVFLRGKCANCKTKISMRYPLVELLTAVLFAVCYLVSGLTLVTLNMCIFTALAVPCFFIDLKHMYLPDIMTIPGLIFALLISVFNTDPNLMDASIGVVFGGGILWTLAFAYKRWRGIDGMGGGDIKLLAWIGALLGFQSVSIILLISSIAGTFVGAYFLMIKNEDSKTFAIPFGPFLITATYIYYFVHNALYWF